MTKQRNMLESVSCGLALLLPCPFSHYIVFIRLFHTGFVIRELPAPAQFKEGHLTSVTSEEMGHTTALLFFSFSVNYCLGKCLCRGLRCDSEADLLDTKCQHFIVSLLISYRLFIITSIYRLSPRIKYFHAVVHIQSYSHMVTLNSSFKTHVCL